jgi:uncharacterized protein
MIYADSNVLVRLIEGLPSVRAPIEARLASIRGMPGSLGTSRLSRLECRVKPLRTGDSALLTLYDAFFASSEIALLEIDAAVIEKATELRAALNLKTPDAIHLASAITAKATGCLTGDRAFLRCNETTVEIV